MAPALSTLAFSTHTILFPSLLPSSAAPSPKLAIRLSEFSLTHRQRCLGADVRKCSRLFGWNSLARTAAILADAEASLEKLQCDVVIVGAGIIGLSIASRLLSSTKLSVAVIDAARPCAGATGAGQGYVWLGHKEPGTESWSFAKRSKELWDLYVEELKSSGHDPNAALGWRTTGSLLVGLTAEDAPILKSRAEALAAEGLHVEYLTSSLIAKVEPDLKCGDETSAIFALEDGQIDAQMAVSYIEEGNREYVVKGRLKRLYEDPVVSFLWSEQEPRIIGVQTSKHSIHANDAVVMAAGAWSGDLMEQVFVKASLPFVLPTRPRKGHLIVLEGDFGLQLRQGLMEFSYTHTLLDPSSLDAADVSMTATMDATGHRLLLGSSRQFAGFDRNIEFEIMDAILKRAANFFPVLESVSGSDVLKQGVVRVGFRPYVPDGKPMIGPIPGIDGILLATGHEGAGLSLALGTAEMVANYILGDDHTVDPSPFLPKGRLKLPNPNDPPAHQW